MRPMSIAKLALDPAWDVTVLTGGRWSVAERAFEHGGSRWVIGLTPVSKVVALIVWRDDEVVAHARGPEARMCAAAVEWAHNVLAGLHSSH